MVLAGGRGLDNQHFSDVHTFNLGKIFNGEITKRNSAVINSSLLYIRGYVGLYLPRPSRFLY